MTQPNTTYSISGYGRLSSHTTGAGTAIFYQRCLSEISIFASMARWICLSTLRRSRYLANEGRIMAVWAMPASGISDRRHDFPRQPYAFDHMVSSNVVCHHPEERCQCPWATAGAGVGQLQDSLGALTQVAASDGSTRSRADADNACPVLLQPVVCQVDLVHPSRQDRRRYADVDRVGCGMTRPKPSRHDACRSFCDNTDG